MGTQTLGLAELLYLLYNVGALYFATLGCVLLHSVLVDVVGEVGGGNDIRRIVEALVGPNLGRRIPISSLADVTNVGLEIVVTFLEGVSLVALVVGAKPGKVAATSLERFGRGEDRVDVGVLPVGRLVGHDVPVGDFRQKGIKLRSEAIADVGAQGKPAGGVRHFETFETSETGVY